MRAEQGLPQRRNVFTLFANRVRRRDMENLLFQLEGKIFTLNTLDALVEHTDIHKFVTKR
jgi:hypothetical protein